MSLAADPGLFAFVAGLASFLSPCVFPLVPVYAGYLGGRVAVQADADPRMAAATAGTVIPATAGAGAAVLMPSRAEVAAATRVHLPRRHRSAPALATGLAFTAGFSAVFVLLFYVLAALELPFQATHRRLIDTVSGVIIIVLALQLIGVLRIGTLMRERKLFHARPGRGLLPGFLLGVSFAAGWTPCIGVQLGAILTVAAGGSFSALPFMLLYCAGLAVPFLFVAVLADRLQGTLRAVNRRLGVINLAAGGLLLIFGVLLITDQVTFFNSLAASGPFGT